jgi:hypothetical protein
MKFQAPASWKGSRLTGANILGGTTATVTGSCEQYSSLLETLLCGTGILIQEDCLTLPQIVQIPISSNRYRYEASVVVSEFMFWQVVDGVTRPSNRPRSSIPLEIPSICLLIGYR